MDLVIAAAINKDDTMIEKVIASIPEYNFDRKFILFDGYEGSSLFGDMYEAQKKVITSKYPDFEIIQFDKNIYFREMINHICKISTSDRLFIIQDDVTIPKIDLKQIEIQMNYVDEMNREQTEQTQKKEEGPEEGSVKQEGQEKDKTTKENDREKIKEKTKKSKKSQDKKSSRKSSPKK